MGVETAMPVRIHCGPKKVYGNYALRHFSFFQHFFSSAIHAATDPESTTRNFDQYTKKKKNSALPGAEREIYDAKYQSREKISVKERGADKTTTMII